MPWPGAARAKGMHATMDDNLIMWLTKDLVSLQFDPHGTGMHGRLGRKRRSRA